ncbi:MAG: acyltransferase [Prevotella sp.]|nr:acyltransferase [Prevotella sp.]
MNPKIYKILNIKTSLKCKWYKLWNPIKFKIFGIHIGKASKMMNKIDLRLDPLANISIGHHFNVLSGDSLNALCRNTNLCLKIENNARLTIGNYVGISGGCIWSTSSISIGDYAHVGANCLIIDGDIHNLDWKERRQDASKAIPYKKGPIIIGDDVWIGANSIILKGVRIGERSIIGAGSIVTHSIPKDCIAAGNPCRVIRNIENGK